MKRFLAALSALLALSVASAGCNSSSVPSSAASVDSVSISTSELNASMSSLKAEATLLCAIGGGAAPITAGTGTNTWSTAFADVILTQLIKFRILDSMVSAHHLVVPASDLAVAKTEVENNLNQSLTTLQQQGTTCPGSMTEAIAALKSSFGRALVANQANNDAYSAYLAGRSLQPAALAAWEQANRAAATLSCSSAIGVATEKEAAKIAKAVRAGASFATQATQHSENIGAGAGGVLGCVPPSFWPGNLAAFVTSLRIDAVSRPAHYQSLWLLVYVSKRELEPTGDVILQLDQLETTAFNSAYAKALERAAISVAAVYGSVKRAQGSGGISLSIAPPSPAACAYATSRSAAGCPSTTTTTIAGSAPAGSSGAG